MAILLLLYLIGRRAFAILDEAFRQYSEMQYQDLLTRTYFMDLPVYYVATKGLEGLELILITTDLTAALEASLQADDRVTGQCLVLKSDMVTVVIDGYPNISITRSQYLSLIA